MLGMTRPSKGQANSRQGFVLASINQTLKLSSIKKSSPKISKENSFFVGLIFV
jgi:hypothetical protein